MNHELSDGVAAVVTSSVAVWHVRRTSATTVEPHTKLAAAYTLVATGTAVVVEPV